MRRIGIGAQRIRQDRERTGNGPAGAGGVIIYFVCEDCAVESARVVKNDGKIVKEKFSIGQYGHIALATDTEGNMIGLHSTR